MSPTRIWVPRDRGVAARRIGLPAEARVRAHAKAGLGVCMVGRVAASIGAAGLIAIASGSALAHESTVIEHVVVLAQKRESALQDVPMSVTALTGSQLTAAGLEDIAEISQRLPTLDQQRTSTLTTTTFRIRRVGISAISRRSSRLWVCSWTAPFARARSSARMSCSTWSASRY